MSEYDRYEDRRQNEKDVERLEAEREARIKRQELEMTLTRRLRDNPDALRVLHGAEDDRLMREIMGQRVPSGTQKLTVIKLQFFAVGRLPLSPILLIATMHPNFPASPLISSISRWI